MTLIVGDGVIDIDGVTLIVGDGVIETDGVMLIVDDGVMLIDGVTDIVGNPPTKLEAQIWLKKVMEGVELWIDIVRICCFRRNVQMELCGERQITISKKNYRSVIQFSEEEVRNDK